MTPERSKTILILGGTSHIAKGLVYRFLAREQCRIEWFGRSRERMEAFLAKEGLSGDIAVHEGYGASENTNADVLINCVGAGTPSQLKADYTLWFSVLEKYDNLCLDYLQNVNPKALYVDFSSGAVYGRDSKDASFRINPNSLVPADYYALAKLYSEAKHRAFREYNIVDIRIFSYFSRYADLKSGYLMTDILNAILNNEVLNTSGQDMIRDYISPDDLFSLIECCMNQPRINMALDAFSKASVSKQEILTAFGERFGLRTEVSSPIASSPNATPSVYVPLDRSSGKIGYSPVHTSLEGLLLETKDRVDAKSKGMV